MTDWRTVQGSQETKPNEFDIASSKKVVYQRINIKRVTVEDIDGNVTKVWQYDERQMTYDEYREAVKERKKNAKKTTKKTTTTTKKSTGTKKTTSSSKKTTSKKSSEGFSKIL